MVYPKYREIHLFLKKMKKSIDITPNSMCHSDRTYLWDSIQRVFLIEVTSKKSYLTEVEFVLNKMNSIQIELYKYMKMIKIADTIKRKLIQLNVNAETSYVSG